MVARPISLPLGVAKVAAVGKAITQQHQLLNFTEEKNAMRHVYLFGKSAIATNINYKNFADGYLQLKCFW